MGAAEASSLASISGSISASGKKNRKRELVKLAADADTVLAKCRALKEKLRRKKENAATASIYTGSGDDGNTNDNNISKDIVEVDELSTTEVLEGIEGVALQITRQVL